MLLSQKKTIFAKENNIIDMNKDNFLGTFTVHSQDKNKDLFRVHFYDKSIRFDEEFAKGFSENLEIIEEIKKINDLWAARELEKNIAFYQVTEIITKHTDKLEPYFFKDYELDKRGQFVDLISIDTVSSLSKSKDLKEYFLYLKKTARLNKIDKKEFEENISNDNIASSYVDNYVKEGDLYFKYIVPGKKGNQTCYLMVVNDTIKVGFTKS